jgi:predicted DsbA family dithiol-disulfide isomerase
MAQDKGLDHAYSMRVLRAFFQENRDIGAPEILIGLAEDAGLDRNEASRALRCRTHAERHRKALRHAREDKAITSVPTVVVGNRVFLGTPRPDELRLAIDQLDGGGDSPLDQTDSHAARHRPSNTTGNERKTP